MPHTRWWQCSAQHWAVTGSCHQFQTTITTTTFWHQLPVASFTTTTSSSSAWQHLLFTQPETHSQLPAAHAAVQDAPQPLPAKVQQWHS